MHVALSVSECIQLWDYLLEAQSALIHLKILIDVRLLVWKFYTNQFLLQLLIITRLWGSMLLFHSHGYALRFLLISNC